MRRGISALLLMLALPAGRASAFDTGHHSDLTRAALARLEFSDHAIKLAQVSNWLTDRYSSPGSPVTKDEFEKLHFDCLFTTAEVDRYWRQLAVNTKAAVTRAAREGNGVMVLEFLGISLHAVQDFYSHSNWVEAHPRAPGAPYRTETWFSAPVGPGVDIHTGWYSNSMYKSRPPQATDEHGDYHKGLNHDAYQRPRWDEAYVFAYAASCEWVAAVSQWVEEVNPRALHGARVMELQGSQRKELEKDLDAAFRISEWIYVPLTADGHWKGPGSGSLDRFLTALTSWTSDTDSMSVRDLKQEDLRYQLLFTRNLYGKTVDGTVPAIRRYYVDRIAVSVHTTHVRNRGIDTPVFAYFYAKVEVSGNDGSDAQTYIEAMQNNRSYSVDTPWWTIHFIDRAAQLAKVRYALFNESTTNLNDDPAYHLGTNRKDHGLEFVLHLRSQICEGDLDGAHADRDHQVTKGGSDSFRGEVKLFVNAVPMAR